jgi:hypothetical protein
VGATVGAEFATTEGPLFLTGTRSRQSLGVDPELSDRHLEIGTYRGHHIAADVCVSSFDPSEVVGAVSQICSQCRLR